jgi:ADP-ribose pyrophosphatase
VEQVMDNLKETHVDGELVYQGHFLKVQRDTIQLPDGKRTAREYILHPGAVVILPLLDDGTVLMERQYRYPLRDVFIEFPAGKIDQGEDPLLAAKRELEEETGYTAASGSSSPNPQCDCVFGRASRPVSGARPESRPAKLDEGEFLETFTATIDELLEWVRDGKSPT